MTSLADRLQLLADEYSFSSPLKKEWLFQALVNVVATTKCNRWNVGSCPERIMPNDIPEELWCESCTALAALERAADEAGLRP